MIRFWRIILGNSVCLDFDLIDVGFSFQIPSTHFPPSHGTAPRGGRIAFIQSCWHKEIVDQCRSAFVVELLGARSTRGFDRGLEVPGVFEIPLQAKLLARTGPYVAIVAAGFVVVDGGIYRRESDIRCDD